MKWQALPLVLVLGWSCKKNQPAPPPATVRPALTPAQLDTMRRDSIFAAEAQRRQDSVDTAAAQVAGDSFRVATAAIAALDSEIAAHPTDPATPLQLFRLAKLKGRLVFLLDRRGSEDPYGKAHDLDYDWDEIGGGWIYTGRDWERLIDGFPTSPVADTAGWYLAHRARGGECEDDWWCAYHGTADPLFAFLAKFPTSGYAARGEKELLDGFRIVVDDVATDMKRLDMGANVDSTRDCILSAFDSQAAGLSPGVRALLSPVSDSLRKHFGLKPARP